MWLLLSTRLLAVLLSRAVQFNLISWPLCPCQPSLNSPYLPPSLILINRTAFPSLLITSLASFNLHLYLPVAFPYFLFCQLQQGSRTVEAVVFYVWRFIIIVALRTSTALTACSARRTYWDSFSLIVYANHFALTAPPFSIHDPFSISSAVHHRQGLFAILDASSHRMLLSRVIGVFCVGFHRSELLPSRCYTLFLPSPCLFEFHPFASFSRLEVTSLI